MVSHDSWHVMAIFSQECGAFQKEFWIFKAAGSVLQFELDLVLKFHHRFRALGDMIVSCRKQGFSTQDGY